MVCFIVTCVSKPSKYHRLTFINTEETLHTRNISTSSNKALKTSPGNTEMNKNSVRKLDKSDSQNCMEYALILLRKRHFPKISINVAVGLRYGVTHKKIDIKIISHSVSVERGNKSKIFFFRNMNVR